MFFEQIALLKISWMIIEHYRTLRKKVVVVFIPLPFLSFQDGNKHWVFWLIPEYFQPEWQPFYELLFIGYF